jgi:hypothetical protein
MRTAILRRTESTVQGTFGTMETDSFLQFDSLELPWKDNQSDISCIPTGIYICTWRKSPLRGYCYHIENVPGRTAIEIHAANFAGDTSLGFRAELLGCIALGTGIGHSHGQKCLFNSKIALTRFEQELSHQNFELTIKETL